ELAEKFNVVHITEGLSEEQVKMMNFAYAPNIEAGIKLVSEMMSQADVAIFPSGGNIIPHIQ
ncbi:MAG: hypothetical protein PVI20_20055, partial [Desulfobacteraceae bacterium]